MSKQTTSNAVQAITSAIIGGDSLREALRQAKADFFKLSRAEWQRVKSWAYSEYAS